MTSRWLITSLDISPRRVGIRRNQCLLVEKDSCLWLAQQVKFFFFNSLSTWLYYIIHNRPLLVDVRLISQTAYQVIVITLSMIVITEEPRSLTVNKYRPYRASSSYCFCHPLKFRVSIIYLPHDTTLITQEIDCVVRVQLESLTSMFLFAWLNFSFSFHLRGLLQ